MKRIVICFDGTWNALTDPNAVTNVVRVGQAVLPTSEGCKQVVYYNAGVGSGGPVDQFMGGVFGVGLRNNVKRGLAYLTLNWKRATRSTSSAFHAARTVRVPSPASSLPLAASPIRPSSIASRTSGNSIGFHSPSEERQT